MKFTCKSAGDQAILIEFENIINKETNNQVRSLASYVEKETIAGFGEVILGYRSLLIHYNPLKLSYEEVVGRIKKWGGMTHNMESLASRRVVIPVLYGGEWGPDINDVASHNNLSTEEVISVHSEGEYLVYFLGFTPGYPFMGGMSKKISTPRMSSPRISIPPGSVGIANNQTGIYPVKSPGGWRLIGRTPLKLYDTGRENPFLLESGDIVRFKVITHDKFLEIEKQNDLWDLCPTDMMK